MNIVEYSVMRFAKRDLIRNDIKYSAFVLKLPCFYDKIHIGRRKLRKFDKHRSI